MKMVACRQEICWSQPIEQTCTFSREPALEEPCAHNLKANLIKQKLRRLLEHAVLDQRPPVRVMLLVDPAHWQTGSVSRIPVFDAMMLKFWIAGICS
jgi:hypothetical protein